MRNEVETRLVPLQKCTQTLHSETIYNFDMQSNISIINLIKFDKLIILLLLWNTFW